MFELSQTGKHADQVQSLEQELLDMKDRVKTDINELLNRFDQEKEIIKSQLEQKTNLLTSMRENTIKDKQIQDEKFNQLQERLQIVNDHRGELERIFEYLYDLNKINMVYVPVVDDKIDKQLADYIKNSDDMGPEINKAKMLFVRESEGIYSYCKKKVFMKI